MHVIHGFVCLATLQRHQCERELALSSQGIMRTEFHIEKDEDFLEMLLSLIIVDWLNVLDLVVYHRVQIILDNEFLPDLNDFLVESSSLAD